MTGGRRPSDWRGNLELAIEALITGFCMAVGEAAVTESVKWWKRRRKRKKDPG